MKKLFRIVCILLVMAMLPVVAFAQMQEEWDIDQGTNTISYSGYDVNLVVDGGYLHLFVPNGYELQAYELSDGEVYPYSYVFIDQESHTQFVVYSSLESEKNQGIMLRKLYDASNKYIVFEDVMISGCTYIVYTKEQAAFDYGFLIREGNGYSYQFQYILPYDTIQNEIPAEAISILSTLCIQASSENTD